MAKQVNDQEFGAVSGLPAPERYSHFLRHVADWGEVWGLKAAGGWVMSADDRGRRLMPVWPNPRYATVCATGDWADATPTAIPLDRWREAWLPGMQRDGIGLAVFMRPNGQGVLVEPDRHASDLDEVRADLIDE
jgi:hypothetical protein